MKRYLLLIVCIFSVVYCYSDETCDDALKEGEKCYKARDYEKAKELFNFVKNECGDLYGDVSRWISECDRYILKPKDTKPSQKNTPIKHGKPTSVETQKPPSPKLLVTGDFISAFSKDGEERTFTIQCDGEWGVTYFYKDLERKQRLDSVFIIEKKDKNKLILSCRPNSYIYSRSVQFDIFVREDRTIKQTIYLTQEAGPYTPPRYIEATADGYIFDSKGGTFKITVSTNATGWYVASMSNWLKCRNKTDNSVEVYCDRNTTDFSRSGTITLKTVTGNKTKIISFEQNKKKKSPSEKYFYNGSYSIKWANISLALGYPFNFDFSILDFRAYWFDISLLNFGIQTDYSGSHNWYWQPNIGVTIPIDDSSAIRLSAGPKYNFTHPYYDYRFGLGKDWLFHAQMGYVFEWDDNWGSEFFVRYNGCVAIGATININTKF